MVERRREREERFLELVEANRARIARIARAYAGADAKDLEQEILLQIWRGLDRFEGRSSAGTWLYRVALNTALTWRRSATHAPPIVAHSASAPEPAGALHPRDAVSVLEEFMRSLPPSDRALLLMYLDDVPYAGMAEITGLTENTVGVRLHRIKRAFKARYIEG